MLKSDRSTPSRRQRHLLISGLCTVLLFALGCTRELGVYSLCEYQNHWKTKVCPTNDKDPYFDFWVMMHKGYKGTAANEKYSGRLRNADVDIKSVLPITPSVKSWDKYDLVFFYGHHNTIESPHGGFFNYWTYDGSAWSSHDDYLYSLGWGDETPYDYWALRPVTDANIHPAAVTYLYNNFTSTLTGGTRDYAGGTVPWRLHWYSPLNHLAHDKLGSNDLEWLILHGCQAVINADYDGNYLPLALNAFAPTQGGWHIVLGHYKSFGLSSLKPLDSFAMDLRSGVPVQQAYFDTDPMLNSSAVAAEKSSFSWATSTMANDAWTDKMADIDDATLFSQRWIQPIGYVGQQWGPLD